MRVSNGNGHKYVKSDASIKSEYIPDGGWGWFVVLACAVTHFLLGGFERSAGILFLELMDRYHESATATAWVFSLNTAFRQLLGPVVSALCQRFGCRIVIMSGGIIFSLSLITCAVSPSVDVLILLYGAIGGFGLALAYAPSLIMVGAYFNKYRGIATGLGTCGVGIGTFIIPPLTQLFLDYYGYFGTMLLLGAISLHLCISGALSRPLRIHWIINRYSRPVGQSISIPAECNSVSNDSQYYAETTSNDGACPLSKYLNEEEQSICKDSPEKRECVTSGNLGLECHHCEHAAMVDDNHQYVTNGHTISCAKSSMAEDEKTEWAELTGKSHMETTEVKTDHLIQENDLTICLDHNNEDNCETHVQSHSPLLCTCFKDVFKSLDLGLLRNLPFLSFSLTIFLFSIAFQTGIVFLPALAQSRGISATESAWMVSVMGVMDALGRVGGAGLTDIPYIRPYRTYIYNVVVLCTAVITLLCPVAHGLLPFMFITGFFGFFSGIYISLKSVIVVDFLGPVHLSSAFGIALCFQGIGSLIGPPISGLVRDTFGRFDEAFFLGGFLTVIAAVILLVGNLSYRRSLRAAA